MAETAAYLKNKRLAELLLKKADSALIGPGEGYKASLVAPLAYRDDMDIDELSTDTREGEIFPGQKWAVPGIAAEMANDQIKAAQMLAGERAIDPGTIAMGALDISAPGVLANMKRGPGKGALVSMFGGRGAKTADLDKLKMAQNALPMDEASRMARADAGGFDFSGYHGTGGNDIDAMKGITWMSETPALANEYAAMRGNMAGDFVGQVMPLKAKTGEVFNADFLPKTVTINHMMNEVLQQADDAGRKLSDDQMDRARELLEVIRKAASREEAGPAFGRHDFWYEPESIFGKDGAAAIKEIFAMSGFDSIRMKEGGRLLWAFSIPKTSDPASQPSTPPAPTPPTCSQA